MIALLHKHRPRGPSAHVEVCMVATPALGDCRKRQGDCCFGWPFSLAEKQQPPGSGGDLVSRRHSMEEKGRILKVFL